MDARLHVTSHDRMRLRSDLGTLIHGLSDAHRLLRCLLLVAGFAAFAPGTAHASQWANAFLAYGLFDAYPTADGGVIAVGETNAQDIWVVKLDGNSNLVWQKSYGGQAEDRAQSVRPTADGGYVVAGLTRSFGAGALDAWVLKLDATGNVVWQKTYGGAGDDIASAVRPTADGGYVVAGATYLGVGIDDAWLLKLDASGNVVWQRTYGGPSVDYATNVEPTSSGGYVLAGFTASFGVGGGDAWLLNLDGVGNVVWQRTYGGAAEDWAGAVKPTADGGYVLVGSTRSFGAADADAWILKLDAAGSVEWQRAYGGVLLDSARGVATTADGGYFVVGNLSSPNGTWNAWLLRLDANGNVVSQQIYDGTFANSVQPTGDGGFVVGVGLGAAAVLKVDAAASIPGCARLHTASGSVLATQGVAGISTATVLESHAVAANGTFVPSIANVAMSSECHYLAPAAATEVPTLSATALSLLSALLGGFGAAAARCRRRGNADRRAG
jgi:hypothetical protein